MTKGEGPAASDAAADAGIVLTADSIAASSADVAIAAAGSATRLYEMAKDLREQEAKTGDKDESQADIAASISLCCVACRSSAR